MISIQEIRQARERIQSYIVQTPVLRMHTLDHYLNCEVYIKAENMQVTGAFKLRGALNRALSLSREELERGLVCASSGNHGRGIAYAAKLLGTKAQYRPGREGSGHPGPGGGGGPVRGQRAVPGGGAHL